MSLSIFPTSTYYRDNYEFRDRPGGYKGLGRDKRHEVKYKNCHGVTAQIS